MQNWERARDMRLLTSATHLEFGKWLAAKAPWGWLITLTHRPPTSSSTTYTRVGLARHNRMVRDWFYDDVRRLDPSARMWGETEAHVAGGFHEHLLLAAEAPMFGVYGALKCWSDASHGGWWDVSPFERARSVELAAMYVEKAAKYAGKMAAQPPKVYGFGLIKRESHSMVLPSHPS